MTVNLIVVTILWAMVAATGCRLLGRQDKNGERRSANTFLAALFGSAALTLNLHPLYLALDSVLGQQNIVDLLKHSCLILCAYFVARAALTGTSEFTAGRSRLLAVAMGGALAVQAVAFIAIDARPSTQHFMGTFGDRPAAFVYSLSHFLFFAAAEGAVLLSAIHLAFRGQREQRVAAIALGIGGVSAVITVAVIVCRDGLRLMSDGSSAIEILDQVYKVLLIVIAVSNCVGLGLPALQGARRRRDERRGVATLLQVLEPAYLRLPPEVRDRFNALPTAVTDGTEGVEDRLDRIIVGLRDAQSSAQVSCQLRPHEETALVAAEKLLKI